jgi:uncharacterized surface protein with fasciclin (FAS1) repeats
MKYLFNLKTTLLFALVVFCNFSCSDNEVVVKKTEEQPTVNVSNDNTISGKVIANADFSILEEALVKTDLLSTLQSNASEYTVFAPKNSAFTTFLATANYATINDVPTLMLKEILLNHVLTGSKKVIDLSNNSYIKTLAKGGANLTDNLDMHISKITGSSNLILKLNGISTVTTADIQATNGTIHFVDAVIVLPKIINHIAANQNLTFFSGLINNSNQIDFLGILNNSEIKTVFVPTNDAFDAFNLELAALPTYPLGLTSLTSTKITKVLKYHVVSSNLLATSLTDNLVLFTLLFGPQQSFQILNPPTGKIIKDISNRESKIILKDVQCSNGVLHIIDKVLKPNL